MNAVRWQKVKDIFGAALELRPDERHRFLAQVCADDEELRLEVESLVASFESADDFIAAPAVEDTFKLLDGQQAKSLAGRRLGQYEIIRELGRGGMGAVYLAVRADDQYQQQVAIKLVKQGFDNQFIIQRFLSERQILANLDHPHIARLLDGGTTDDGAPYLVMEYIAGLPIDEYCDAHKLSTVERLKLFRTICSAVQYAHQNLVIHRDIKPSNILVTKDGTPKLLDFGIAKLLSPEGAAPAVERTATAMRLMTLDYASPEQVRGEQITTATDVYSLGVLLYKLLTGHHPYRFTTPLPQEIERVICEQEPERPSTAASKRMKDEGGRMKVNSTSIHPSSFISHPSALRGDLDNIILMALRKEPARRYASVSEFSEDIRRHLEGLPVRARQDAFTYRSAKFIRRHKLGVASALLLALALVGGIVATAREARLAARQRDKAERVSRFLQDTLSYADPSWYSPGHGQKLDVKVVDVLHEAAQKLETELADQPEVRAELHHTIGNIYRARGTFDGDQRYFDLAEGHFQAALKLRRALYGERHAKVAESLYYLGAVRQLKSDNATAQALFRQALAILRAVDQRNANLPYLLQDLGASLIGEGKADAAEPLLREALTLFRQRYGEEHLATAALYGSFGKMYEVRGDLTQAQAMFRECAARLRRLPDRSMLPDVLIDLSRVDVVRSEYAEAEASLNEARDLARQCCGENHPQVTRISILLASLYYRQGNLPKAEATLNQALELDRRLLPERESEYVEALSLLNQVSLSAQRVRSRRTALARSSSHPQKVADEEKSGAVSDRKRAAQ